MPVNPYDIGGGNLTTFDTVLGGTPRLRRPSSPQGNQTLDYFPLPGVTGLIGAQGQDDPQSMPWDAQPPVDRVARAFSNATPGLSQEGMQPRPVGLPSPVMPPPGAAPSVSQMWPQLPKNQSPTMPINITTGQQEPPRMPAQQSIPGGPIGSGMKPTMPINDVAQRMNGYAQQAAKPEMVGPPEVAGPPVPPPAAPMPIMGPPAPQSPGELQFGNLDGINRSRAAAGLPPLPPPQSAGGPPAPMTVSYGGGPAMPIDKQGPEAAYGGKDQYQAAMDAQRVQDMVQKIMPRRMGLDLGNPSDPFNQSILREDMARGTVGSQLAQAMMNERTQGAGQQIERDKLTQLAQQFEQRQAIDQQRLDMDKQKHEYDQSPAALKRDVVRARGALGPGALDDLQATMKAMDRALGGGIGGVGASGAAGQGGVPAVEEPGHADFLAAMNALRSLPAGNTDLNNSGTALDVKKFMDVVNSTQRFQTPEGAASLLGRIQSAQLPGGFDKFKQTLLQNVIRQANEASGGTIEKDGVTLPNGFRLAPQRNWAGEIGSYDVVGPDGKVRSSVQGPGNGILGGLQSLGNSPFRDFMPTVTDSTRQRYAQSNNAIAPLLSLLLGN